MVDVVFPYVQFEYEQAALGSIFVAPHANSGKSVIGIKATWNLDDLVVVLSPDDDPDGHVPFLVGLSRIRPGRLWVVADAKLSIDHSPESIRFDRSPAADREMVGAICVKRGGEKLLAVHSSSQPFGVAYLDLAMAPSRQPSKCAWFYRCRCPPCVS